MGAILGGTMRAPLTGAIFAFELTNDYHSILPLLIACMAAHAFTVLTLKRSILTEKIARRGHHLTREYQVDPLEALAVKDVMRTNITAFPAETTVAALQRLLSHNENGRGQRLYPVISDGNKLLGVFTREDLQTFTAEMNGNMDDNAVLASIVNTDPVVAHPDERLRTVASRMAVTGHTRMPVVQPGAQDQLLGMVALHDLLKAREQSFMEEQRRERVLRLRLLPSLRRRQD